ncbi:hypothetical protein HAX54_003338, partial [Datura stramonium]|nr:hypothetical protein [Datura stramonium]
GTLRCAEEHHYVSREHIREGTKLQGASRVVFLDVLLNPSVQQQAIGRAYRNGRTKLCMFAAPSSIKMGVDKIGQGGEGKKVSIEIYFFSRNEVNTFEMDPSCYISEDNILESMVKHEPPPYFEKLSHAPV